MIIVETRMEEDQMNSKPEPPSIRTLDENIPELLSFLKPGMRVLDVGCGTGTITLGVAEVVKPGAVVGIDPDEPRIDTARKWAAHVMRPKNVTFHVGDSHRLEFPDHTFDVVYSHTVLHFFLDPVVGLQEQKRVTKPGGWVIASGVRDMGITYPPCPHWEKVYDAFRRFCITYLEDYQASGQDPVAFLAEKTLSQSSGLFYYDMHGGRKCAEWFHRAGCVDIRIEVQPRSIKYQGHERMKPNPLDLLIFDESASDGWGEYQSTQKRVHAFHQHMIDMGFLNNETIERATAEAREFYSHPGAFQFWPEIFATGRVP